jgi:hypothetical protein
MKNVRLDFRKKLAPSSPMKRMSDFLARIKNKSDIPEWCLSLNGGHLARLKAEGYLQTPEEIQARVKAAIEEATIKAAQDPHKSFHGAPYVHPGDGFRRSERKRPSKRINKR